MKHLLIRGLALSLGLLATSARGQETVWRSTPAAPGAGKPIAIAVSRPATPQPTPAAAPAASIGRPVAAAVSDPAVRPVSFSRTPDPAQPIIRGAAPDSVARPMPSAPTAGDPLSGSSMSQGNWRRADDVFSSPLAVSNPNGSGTILPAPTPDPVVGGQPVLIAPPASLFGTNGNGASAAGVTPGAIAASGPGCGCGQTFVGGRMTAGGACCPTNACCGGGACCGQGGLWGRYVEPMFAGMGDPDGSIGGPRLALSAEYLLWWMKGDQTPPLAVAVPTVGGMLAPPGTTLIGGRSLGDTAQSGVRASAIWWFSDQQLWGIGVGGLYLGQQTNNFVAGGPATASPVVGRPFFDTSVGGAPALELVAGLGLLQGNVEVARRSTLWGYDINFYRNLYNDCSFSLTALVGYRQLGLDESLRITENLTQAVPITTAAGATFPAGSTFQVTDKFSTSNRFYGAQVGLTGLWRFSDAWSLGFTGKVAIGTTQQTVDISGSTTVSSGGVSQTLPGGLLTQAGTNIGRYTQNRFGVVPEGGLTLGYNVTDWWRLTAGYNFLYWSNVARPGDQVNLNVNRTLLPFRGGAAVPGAQPAFLGRTTDYYAQGVTFGMLFTF